MVALVTTVNVPSELVAVVGKYVTSMVHVPASGSVAPVQLSAVLTKGAAETVALAIVKLMVPPVFSIVKVAVLELPIDTLPKLLVEGVMLPVTVGPVTPVPSKDEILLVPLVALVTTVNVPKDTVTAVGKYVTSMVHVPASGSVAPVQLSAVFVKGAATVALAMVRLTVPPVFSTVKVAVLELPIDTLPKSLVAGVIVAVTDGPVTPVPTSEEIF